MKKGLIFRMLALSCLVGCNYLEVATPGGPDNVPEGSALLQVSVGYPQAEGYAVGDNEAADVATAQEKDIRSVAFFVKTSHAFGKYMSTELLFSAQGLTKPLKKEALGKYTASFLVKSPKFVDGSEVLVVANYAENGLDFTNVKNIREVKALVSKALDGTANLTTPLLMYGQNDNVILKNTETTAASFTMERLVARVDVRNLAANATDPEKGFVLTSARLLNAPTASMILPDLLSEIAGADFPLRTVGADASRIDTLYVFENKNTNEALRTRIEINGRLKGTPVHKTIEFKKPDEPGSIGEPIALARNTRYVVQIQPISDSTDVRFDLKVKKWGVADTVQIKPDKKAIPEIDVSGFIAGAGARWDAATKTLDITAATESSTFAVTVRCNLDTDVQTESLYGTETDHQWWDGSVTREGLQGYASLGQLSRVYRFTVPVVDPNTYVAPTQKNVIVYNLANRVSADTIKIKYTPITFGDYNPEDIYAKGAKWDETNKIIDLTDASGTSTFTFMTATTVEKPTVEVKDYGATTNWLKSNTVLSSTAEESKLGADSYKCTLTLPNAATPEASMLILKAGGKQDTVFVRSLKAQTHMNTTALTNGAAWDPGKSLLTMPINPQAKGESTLTYCSLTADKPSSVHTFSQSTWMKDKINITTNIETKAFATYTCKITLPVFTKTMRPSEVEVKVKNGSIATVRPVYPTTTWMPVMIADAIFAPVNVGATAEPGTAVTLTWDLATCGHLYQWGRNKPFAYGPTDDYQQGSVAYNTVQNAAGESVGVYKDKFIKILGDWLVAGEPDFSTRNALWTPAVNISPCPIGWRVPTTAELGKLMGFPTSKNTYANGLVKIPSDNEFGTSLYLPAAGCRTYVGTSVTVGTYGNYWSSTFFDNGKARTLSFKSASIYMDSSYTTYGQSLRCVQE